MLVVESVADDKERSGSIDGGVGALTLCIEWNLVAQAVFVSSWGDYLFEAR